jgi:hypothetical protein
MTDTETGVEPATEPEPIEGGEPAGEPEPEPEPEQGEPAMSDADTATVNEYNEQAGDDDADDDAPPPEPEPEPDEPGAQAEPDPEAQVQSQRELEKRSQRLDGENTRHAKRVGEIMADAAADLIPCPVCMDGIAGWIYPPEVQTLSPDAIARVRSVIGLPDYTTYLPANFGGECPECGGLGNVITGSHVPGYETATCERCKGQGWVRTSELVRVEGEVPHPEPTVTGPTVYTGGDDDIEVANLRRRGFTVIPPMQVQAG